jgi:eukaryotic-like serine/threonine-protein kinase
LMRLNDAKAEMARGHKLGLDGSTDYAGISFIANFFLGEASELQRLLAQVAGRPDEFLVTQNLIGTQQFSGRYKLAATTVQQAFEQAGHAKAPDVQAAILLTDAAARGMADSCAGSDTVVRQALALDRSKQTQEFAVWAGAVCGSGKQALALAQELGAKYPEDTLIQDVFLPLAKAYVALSDGRFSEAVDVARPAKPYDFLYPGSYVQGLAYLQLHDAMHARSAFASAMQSQGNLGAGSLPFYAQAQLGLARAYAMGGDKANAKKAYEAFFTTWKDADPELPMLVAAKKEYSSL